MVSSCSHSPLLKGYSPGFTVDSCDADRAVVDEDDEDSVLVVAERGRFGLG